MKILIPAALVLLLVNASPSSAQSQQPFFVKLYGGLFFPSNDQFHDLYGSRSEAIWGVGASLPLGGFMFLDGDIGFFRASAFVDPQKDSSVSLEENIIHVGLLSKQLVGRLLFFRAMVGLNYAAIRQKYTSPLSSEVALEADKKIGYFAGAGLERMLENGQASLFADLMYDYRRSHQKELEGDFGGVRLVIGIHVILF